jgi:hypothetical protein
MCSARFGRGFPNGSSHLRGLLDHRDDLADGHRFSLALEDVLENTSSIRCHFDVDLFGFQLDEHVAWVDRITFAFPPRADNCLDDRLAHLRHTNLDSHRLPSRSVHAGTAGSGTPANASAMIRACSCSCISANPSAGLARSGRPMYRRVRPSSKGCRRGCI